MKKIYFFSLLGLFSGAVHAQTKTITTTETVAMPHKANYQQAARFSPSKLRKMIYSTSVDPHWLKQRNNFWYEYETPNGKNWYIVDPAARSKKKTVRS
ncbi:hypothetical protein [Pedobacter sp. UBA4863]|uniref:hypothetical protein n=1 Tax=Pedobacter sp. UBA4863 TaxID=1947060 RepID=UPI0025E6C27D|nr:hypothetical protein [Pedobacter sp. UBA4863]